jgi:predicted RNA binding protein with dsRBD fold (UPF0201 family)
MMNLLKKVLFVSLCLVLPLAVSAQTKTRKSTGKKAVKVVKKTPAVTADPVAEPAVKKNERPEDDAGGVKTNKREEAAIVQNTPKPLDSTHFYYFTQPAFVTSSISIEHDDTGRGKISFQKTGLDEPITDPLQVSAAALERIANALKALKFFDSTENYQYEKDYSHMGNIKIRVKENGRERTVMFNWTLNKDAKALADEYRKIGNQAIWIFDVTVARENQPLEAPKMLDNLDSLIRRGEISDTAQMLPFLQGLSNDERIPLIARNHAAKLIKQIEKEQKK